MQFVIFMLISDPCFIRENPIMKGAYPMKKLLILILALCLMLPASAALAKEYMILGTGSTGGTYYSLGGDIASLWMKYLDVDVTATETAASKANILAINEGEQELGLAQNDMMYYAATGDADVFAGEKIEGFATIASLYPEAVQIVVGADTDITKVSDLKGKNVSIGQIGSGTMYNAIQVLGAAGLSVDDVNAQYLSFTESAAAFQNRQVDALFITAGLPNPSVEEAASKRPIRLLVLEDDQMKALQEKYGFYVAVTVPQGTYKGMEKDLVIPSTNAVLICSRSLDEELVYNLTKVLFEKKGELMHAKGAEISPEYAVEASPVDFHPGAVRYYREIGLMN